MPKLTSGIYFEVTEIDWEDPKQVEGAKRVMAEMRHFVRNLSGSKNPFHGFGSSQTLPVNAPQRSRLGVNPLKFSEMVEAVERVKGDLRAVSSVLRLDYNVVYNRILIYKKKGYFRMLPDKRWEVVDNPVVRELRALTA